MTEWARSCEPFTLPSSQPLHRNLTAYSTQNSGKPPVGRLQKRFRKRTRRSAHSLDAVISIDLFPSCSKRGLDTHIADVCGSTVSLGLHRCFRASSRVRSIDPCSHHRRSARLAGVLNTGGMRRSQMSQNDNPSLAHTLLCCRRIRLRSL